MFTYTQAFPIPYDVIIGRESPESPAILKQVLLLKEKLSPIKKKGIKKGRKERRKERRMGGKKEGRKEGKKQVRRNCGGIVAPLPYISCI